MTDSRESANWVLIDQAKLYRVSDADLHRHAGELVSPYDVPEAVVCNYEQARGLFRITLRYSGVSEPTTIRRREAIELHLGKHSHRVYGIDIDTRALGDPPNLEKLRRIIENDVARVLGEILVEKDCSPRRDNYLLAERAIEMFCGKLNVATASDTYDSSATDDGRLPAGREGVMAANRTP